MAPLPRTRIRLGIVTLTWLAAALFAAPLPGFGQGQTYTAPRTASGQPDLNGFWQALNTAHWDLEAHEAAPGPVLQLGAAYAVPPGLGVVRRRSDPVPPGRAGDEEEVRRERPARRTPR